MSSSNYPAQTTSGLTNGHYRPATIAELAARAQANLWDPSKGLKHWLRTAEKARRTAETYIEVKDYENAFIEYAKAATIVLEKLPHHKEYLSLLNADQRHNLGMVSPSYPQCRYSISLLVVFTQMRCYIMFFQCTNSFMSKNGQDILDSLSQLKPILVDRYEQWLDRERAQSENGRSSMSTPSQVDGISREEAARRRRDQQLRAQEEERAQHARDAARREQEWKKEDAARREAEERERQVREDPVWSRQLTDAKRREEIAAAAEARRANEARATAERERAAHTMRKEDDLRRIQYEERRRQEEGITRRQEETEATTQVARRDIAMRLSPIPSTVSFARLSLLSCLALIVRQYDSSVRPVTTPQPSRPPSSNQQPAFPDPVPARSVVSIMPLESPVKNDEDSSTDIEGIDSHISWNRSRHGDTSPTKGKPPAA